MKDNKRIFVFWLSAAALVMGLLALSMPMPPVVYAGLPPRETPPPVNYAKPGEDNSPAGATIELNMAGAPAGAWAVVQWQDSAGGWRDVEGWSGTVSDSSRWWVHPKDFGTGPFRWIITRGKGGPAQSASEVFHLPASANQVLQVEMAPAKN